MPDRETRPRGGEDHGEINSKRSAGARLLQRLVGELLKGFEQESHKLWFTFSKATLACLEVEKGLD